ncbi:hypothetical protein [Sciscionella marina]|uniref:hypothetical protein n=1 Tax=Sciscionella marina TaxID=508770 RepID=UPI00037CDF5E|nr:hypothetical protein [Sciscionella marina]
MTQITQQARRQLIATRVEAADTSSRARRTFKWRDQDVSWPEVQIPVTHALLNPRSHRIKPQVESVAARQRVIVDDPFGAEAQEVVAQIIQETPGYKRIEAELLRDGQLEPGVMTSEGVLINANTRLVALRELGFSNIKVHVLPSDATEAELTDLELSFQMRRDVKQDYSFTAQLLFIRDLLNDGWSPERIGLEMDRSLDPNKESDRKQAAQRAETDARILNIIENVIASSNGNLSYAFFDDEQQTLKDIDSAYQAHKDKNPGLAERERNAKITGMLAGLDYRRVRQIDGTYLNDYAVAALDEQAALHGHAWPLAVGSSSTAPDVSLDGLDVLDDVLTLTTRPPPMR